MNGKIYIITNLLSGKRYVGQTMQTLEKRWKEHLRDARNGRTCPLHAAIRKYGPESFSIEVLVFCGESELNPLEKFAILIFNSLVDNRSGYNVTEGGHDNGRKRKRHSEETKKKIGAAHKGRVFSEETLQKMRARKRPDLAERNRMVRRQTFLGKRHSEEARRKISAKMQGHKRCVGRVLSEETKQKIRASLLARREAQNS